LQNELTEDAANDDSELFSRARDGEISFFEELVERHRDDVYAFGLMMIGEEADAAQIAQESFLSGYLHLQQFDNETEFCTWVYRIAARHAELRLRYRGDRHNGAEVNSSALKLARGGAPRATAKTPVTNDTEPCPELQREIQDAAERLPRRHRAVLFLKEVLGLSYKRVSEITGYSIEEIKPCLYEARLKVHDAVQRFVPAQ
jgi:RNA polymerase sigma-70 factor (ECF subfamily)